METEGFQEAYEDERGICRASVVLRCAWTDRHSLVSDICGQRRTWPYTVAGPQPKATTASIVPVLTGAVTTQQTMDFSEALVTVNYTTAIEDVVSESIEPTVEFITLDHKAFCWGSGNGTALTEKEAPGRLMRDMNFVRNEIDQSTLPLSLITLVGTVNNAAIVGSILNFTFAPETLLYQPPVINYKRTSLGDIKFDITKKFSFKPQGWNVFYRTSTASWQRIFRRGSATAYNNFPLADQSALF